MKMRRIPVILPALLVMAISCTEKEAGPDTGNGAGDGTRQVPEVMKDLWETSPADKDMTARMEAFGSIQKYADECSDLTFSKYLEADDRLAASLAMSVPILECYDAAFDRVLEGVAKTSPAEGEVHIWMLYNMGYVIKTPSGCFGIDIYHRRGAELAPYLDFYASTHVHQDHRCDALADAMIEAGKPVLTNWLDRPGYSWTSTSAEDYEIGGFSIHTFITRHNNGDTNVPVTVFQISCGEDTDHFTLLHSGDSNFIADEYDVTADIDVYIPRYAPNALTENNVIGKVFSPDYVLLSHILELSHADPSVSRWTLEQGLERASELDCEKTYMPFWGETAIWKDGELNFNLYTD